MIVLKKGTVNTNIILTLSERVTLVVPYFLFAFYCVETKMYQYFIAADLSIYPYRYNKFTITEKSTPAPNPLIGEVYLQNIGEWLYSVYEQSSSTNLNPALATTLLETGQVFVEPLTAPAARPYYSPQPNTNAIYGS